MKAVGAIRKELEWSRSRIFFYWRLRRKLAEFALRKKVIEAGNIRKSLQKVTSIEASALIKEWFLKTPLMTLEMWDDDKKVLNWMGTQSKQLRGKVLRLMKSYIIEEVFQTMSAGGETGQIGTSGILEGIKKAFHIMTDDEKKRIKHNLKINLEI